MANELSGEWSAVSGIAHGVQSSRQQIAQAESAIASARADAEAAQKRERQAEEALAQLPTPSGDNEEEARQIEELRAMYEGEISDARAARSDAESRGFAARSQRAQAQEQLKEYQSEASNLSGRYNRMASQYQERKQKTSQAGDQLRQISGMRFGSEAASAGANLTDQREQHYQSLVTGYRELSQAAMAAADGVVPSSGDHQVAERGGYSGGQPGASSAQRIGAAALGAAAATGAMNKADSASGAGTRAQRMGAAVLGAAAATGAMNKAHSVSLAGIPEAGRSASQTEQAMADHYGMSLEDFRAFQQENGMTLATDGSSVQMVQNQEIGMGSLRAFGNPETGPETLDDPGRFERGFETGHFSSPSTADWSVLEEPASPGWGDIDPKTFFDDSSQSGIDADTAARLLFDDDDEEEDLPEILSEETKIAIANRNSAELDWNGSAGNSLRIPRESSGELARELQKYGVSGIGYRHGDVDFSPVSQFTINCGDPSLTYSKLGHDIKLGDLYKNGEPRTRDEFNNIIRRRWQKYVAEDIVDRLQRDSSFAADFQESTGIDVSKVRSVSALSAQLRAHGLTMHETPDCKSIQLVPTAIHKAFKHSGGTAEMLEKLIDADTGSRVESKLGTETSSSPRSWLSL